MTLRFKERNSAIVVGSLSNRSMSKTSTSTVVFVRGYSSSICQDVPWVGCQPSYAEVVIVGEDAMGRGLRLARWALSLEQSCRGSPTLEPTSNVIIKTVVTTAIATILRVSVRFRANKAGQKGVTPRTGRSSAGRKELRVYTDQ